MTYTLILLICLGGSPHLCETREQIIEDLAGHPAVAFMQAQAVVGRWINDHPGLVIQRWQLHAGVRS